MAAPQLIRSQSYERIYELVVSAITDKRPISATYKGFHRLLCPYLLGRNRDGSLRILCYQFGGESKSALKPLGSPDNWRCLELEKLSEVVVLSDEWFTPPNYSPHQTCIETVEAEVKEPSC